MSLKSWAGLKLVLGRLTTFLQSRSSDLTEYEEEMSATYEIVIQNNSNQVVDFMVFQKQATFTNLGIQLLVFSNSLGSGRLAPYGSSGTRLHFPFDTQTYAGAQTNQLYNKDKNEMQTVELAAQLISLADESSKTDNNTSLSLDPFGLSPATYDPSVPVQNFGITVPSYSPSPAANMVCGVIVVQSPATQILSSYVTPTPNKMLYCAPLPIFYVTVGSAMAGDPVTYDITNAACCDFTKGYSQINVAYATNGQFSVIDN